MGGTTGTRTSNSLQNINQNQVMTGTQRTDPYGVAKPGLDKFLGGLGEVNPNITSNEDVATQRLASLGLGGNKFTPVLDEGAYNALSGGGFVEATPRYERALGDYEKSLSPFLSKDYLDPRNNPGFGDVLDTLRADITSGVNQQFAGAGRDMSGLNLQALGRGVTQGLAPVIADQYNRNVATQRGAQDALFGGRNATSNSLMDLRSRSLDSMARGAALAGGANEARTSELNNVLAAEAARRGIPLQTMQSILNSIAPTAQAFGTGNFNRNTTTTGTSTGSGTVEESQPFNPWSLAGLAALPLSSGGGFGSSLLGMGLSRLFPS